MAVSSRLSRFVQLDAPFAIIFVYLLTSSTCGGYWPGGGYWPVGRNRIARSRQDSIGRVAAEGKAGAYDASDFFTWDTGGVVVVV